MGAAFCHLVPIKPYSLVEWKYDISYVKRGEDDCVGSGAFGQVRPCVERLTLADRCVKTIPKADWWTRPAVMQEIEILEMVSGKHPNIVEYFEYFEEMTVIHLILEYCAKGNLNQMILSRKFREGGERLSAKIVYQIAGALALLREVEVVHRDVKPSNLVFAEDDLVKLTDFGCACLATTSEAEDLKEIKGTPCFFSPEIHQLPRGRGYSFPADMWAFGICSYMMLCKGAHPFMTEKGSLRTREHHSGIFDVDWFTSWAARDALQWMLMPHPGQRILPQELMEHKWCYSYNLGGGTFSKSIRQKHVLDSHGNWVSIPI
mmetsp:Transcript_61654/g.115283  ORF Transcript_61654/g.115283 Transcript_61654/m.115283 type:complete len:318 (-) Transcript_61654:27-980(-)